MHLELPNPDKTRPLWPGRGRGGIDVHDLLDRQAWRTSGPIRRVWLGATLPLVRLVRRMVR